MVEIVEVVEDCLLVIKVNEQAQRRQTQEKTQLTDVEIIGQSTINDTMPLYNIGKTRTIDGIEVPAITLLEQYQQAMITAAKRGANYVSVNVEVIKPGCLLGLFFPEKIKTHCTYYKRR